MEISCNCIVIRGMMLVLSISMSSTNLWLVALWSVRYSMLLLNRAEAPAALRRKRSRIDNGPIAPGPFRQQHPGNNPHMCHWEVSERYSIHGNNATISSPSRAPYANFMGGGFGLNWHGDEVGSSDCIPLCGPPRHVQVWRWLYLSSLTCRRSSRHHHGSISKNLTVMLWWERVAEASLFCIQRNLDVLCFTVEQFTISPFLSPALSS